ncbi:hypothetical protein [Streptomyces sp. SID14515]|uniref:hypothetical protein n=1 Tax=Streptomyces sp. SID14515 TaxID=2706074 RepID=UPI0013C54AB5|nr:hypothetical protein [Streptomyces sp. SID14515]NEB35908.1 hypothetical protein [Streptomyces sp. SID14515]
MRTGIGIRFTWWFSLTPGEPSEGEGGAETPEDARKALEMAVQLHVRDVEDEEERRALLAGVLPQMGVFVARESAAVLKRGRGALYNDPGVAVVRLTPGPLVDPLGFGTYAE